MQYVKLLHLDVTKKDGDFSPPMDNSPSFGEKDGFVSKDTWHQAGEPEFDSRDADGERSIDHL